MFSSSGHPRPSLCTRHDRSTVLLVQGGYYLIAGGWATGHPNSFERVARRKLNHLQLSATGSLFVAIGATLVAGARRTPVPPPVVLLAVLTPVAAAQTEVRYRRALPPILFVDFLAQGAFAVALALSRKDGAGSTGFPGLRHG